MKKTEIINLGKEKYNLDSRTVNQVLEFVFGLSKENLFLYDEFDSIYDGQISFIFEKLLSGYPLAYIIKKVNFMGMVFFVDENVLIPRDDTEVLVNGVVNHCENSEVIQSDEIQGRFPTSREGQILLDIGTGSGIIPISLAKNVDFEEIYAIDISESALEVAKENVFRHCLEDKIKVIKADFKKFEFELFRGKNLVVTANLPYIKEGDFENMDFGVHKFEPKIALYGGINTGFELYEELITLLIEKKEVFQKLVLFIEIGFDQYNVSKDFLLKKGLKFEIFKDTNNIHRVVKIIL